MYLRFKGHEDAEIGKILEDAGLNFSYDSKWKRYDIKINSFNEYQENRELFIRRVNNAKEYLL
jgi:hypothetical protein